MMKRTICFTVLAVLMGSPAAYAKVATKPVVGYIAGGYAAPVGQAGEFFDPGWNISGGVTFHFDPELPVGLRLDLGYSRFNAEQRVIVPANYPGGDRVDGGYMSMKNLSVDAIYEFGGKGHIGGYIGAGIGGYSQYWTITRTVVVYGPPFCDPIWGGCFPYDEVIEDSDRLTKLGYNASLAITFPLQSGGEIYVEGRYHRMDSNPATEYVPVVIGYRW